MCLVSATSGCSARDEVRVVDQETGEVYYSAHATDGLRITLRWIHSVEKTPWSETYVVEEGELVLTDITIEGYGAGVPADPGGVTTVEGGVIHSRGINRPIPELAWVHSHATDHELTVGNYHIATDDIPHHAFVTLSIED